MSSIEIVSVSALSEEDKKRIEAVDSRIHVTSAGDWFDDEIAATWPAQTARNLAGKKSDAPPKAERDAVLAEAEIVTLSFPYPLDLRARARQLKWAHQRNAGANNLWRGDLWKSDVMVTTTRGEIAPYPIAEYAVAGLLHAARDFNQATADRAAGAFDRAKYAPVLLAGKTVCIVGAGGIGLIAGKLLAGLGMTVLGVRHTARPKDPLPEGFSEMRGHDGLLDLLARSDAAVIACQLTADTTNLMNAKTFGAMRPGSLIVNVARGEVVDETALLDALDSGQLKGAVLDVYVGEHDGPPPPRLWNHPGVLITPHNSPRAGAVGPGLGTGMGIRIFCENLRAYLDGRPLMNVIDWTRGY